MTTIQEVVSSSFFNPTVSLTWNVENWRSSEQYRCHLQDKNVYVICSPEFKVFNIWSFAIDFSCYADKNGWLSQTFNLTLHKKNEPLNQPKRKIDGFLQLRCLYQETDWSVKKELKSDLPNREWGEKCSISDFRSIPESLEILAEFQVTSKTGITSSEIREKCQPTEIPKDFVDTMSKLLEDPIFSDVTILIGMRSFKVHRAMLAAQSPVLRAMLCSDMKERQEGEIRIDDSSPEAWELFMRFLYTQSFELDDPKLELLSEVAMLADKYNVPTLFRKVETDLLNILNVGNVMEFFRHSFLYEMPKIKPFVDNLMLVKMESLRLKKEHQNEGQ